MCQLGVQLYTVRDLLTTEREAEKTIAAIKQMGYETAQLSGEWEQLPLFAQLCRSVGLTPVGILADLDTCEQHQQEIFALCEKYSIADIGVSSPTKEYDDAMAYIPRVNRFAGQARAQGISFSYHNHGHEFIRTACGKTVMELFLQGFDPVCVDLMPDTYWIQDGGADVRHFLSGLSGRVKILHLKDMRRTREGRTYAPIGGGNLYFEGILQTARQIGVRHFIVEQDTCDGDPLECLRQSINYLNRNGLL